MDEIISFREDRYFLLQVGHWQWHFFFIQFLEMKWLKAGLRSLSIFVSPQSDFAFRVSKPKYGLFINPFPCQSLDARFISLYSWGFQKHCSVLVSHWLLSQSPGNWQLRENLAQNSQLNSLVSYSWNLLQWFLFPCYCINVCSQIKKNYFPRCFSCFKLSNPPLQSSPINVLKCFFNLKP